MYATAGADGAVASREALALESATNPAQGRAKEFKALVRQQQAAIRAATAALTKAQQQASALRMGTAASIVWGLRSTATGLANVKLAAVQ